MRIEGATPFQAGGEEFLAMPQRALWWPRLRFLVVADTHFGKDAIFRREGVPMPSGTDEASLRRLDALMTVANPQALWVLGDFLHGRLEPDQPFIERFNLWRASHATVRVAVTSGNHDRHQRDRSAFDGVEWMDEYESEGIVLRHRPSNEAKQFVISGHLHPVYRIADARKSSARLPVFWIRENGIVLPAFSLFTGGEPIKPSPCERVIGALESATVPLLGD